MICLEAAPPQAHGNEVADNGRIVALKDDTRLHAGLAEQPVCPDAQCAAGAGHDEVLIRNVSQLNRGLKAEPWMIRRDSQHDLLVIEAARAVGYRAHIVGRNAKIEVVGGHFAASC